MRCSRCGTDNKLKDRTENNGCCKNCRHPFAYEPTTMPYDTRFTDAFFKNVIETASANNTLFFTHRQWLYLFDRRLRSKKFSGLLGCVILLFFFTIISGMATQGYSLRFTIPMIISLLIINWFYTSYSQQFTVKQKKFATRALQVSGFLIIIASLVLLITSPQPAIFLYFVLGVLLGMFMLYWGTIQRLRFYKLSQAFAISELDLQNWSERWTQINGTISQLLPPPRRENQLASINPEVSSYSFDRAIICDRPEIAQFLIANNFHFENNCAVLSIDGYPQNIFSTVLEMLKRNPNLEVYALHDASPQGISLIHQLETHPDWFANRSVKIYDIGILPRQIFNHPNCFIANSQASARVSQALFPEIRQELMAEELTWLDRGNYVELESLMPQRLLQLASRGITLSRTGEIETLTHDNQFIFVVDSFG